MAIRRGDSTTLFEFTGRDPESRAPDPAIGSLDRGTSAESLSERLGHRVARELLVAAEGNQ